MNDWVDELEICHCDPNWELFRMCNYLADGTNVDGYYAYHLRMEYAKNSFQIKQEVINGGTNKFIWVLWRLHCSNCSIKKVKIPVSQECPWGTELSCNGCVYWKRKITKKPIVYIVRGIALTLTLYEMDLQLLQRGKKGMCNADMPRIMSSLLQNTSEKTTC